jgi:MFS family permease
MLQPQLGLRQNIGQFSLLVLVNALVGAMVGMERSILGPLAESRFGLTSSAVLMQFLVAFGLAKAVANYATAWLAPRYGRRWVLRLGWLLALPVPWMLGWAPNWGWVVAANVLLGLNQGLAWSSTVVMKMDLVDDRQRGLAMGLNEFAGYLAVAVAAGATGWAAQRWGLGPHLFIAGGITAALGTILSFTAVRRTERHVAKAASESTIERLCCPFAQTTWKHPALGSVSQAGLVNNLNDALVWGFVPTLLWTKGFSLSEIGQVAAIYPAVWGIAQLATGPLSDRVQARNLIALGMIVQALALAAMPWLDSPAAWTVASAVLGLGTALVYPTFLSAVAQWTHPSDRASALGIFRFWRDLGYALGALLVGGLAATVSANAGILTVAALTLASGVLVAVRMPSATNTLNK